MTATRTPAGFAGVDPPPRWPTTRGRARPETLARPLDTLPGVGPTVKRKLAKLGLETVRDLLEHRPRRYESAADVRIADLQGDEEVVIEGEVLTATHRRRGRLTIVTACITDGSASISASWFNQPWLAEQLTPGTRVRLRGRPGRYGFDVRSYDLGDADATADFAPVYPASEELTAKKVRDLVTAVLPHAGDYGDPLPTELKGPRAPAAARRRVAHDPPAALGGGGGGRAGAGSPSTSCSCCSSASRAVPASASATLAPSLGEPGELIERYRKALPFALTPYQEQAVREIDADLARTIPMQRLLQGDVGSGKTVVALYALLRAVENGRQGALMAPTETLAEQHFLTIEGICAELGVTCALLTSALGAPTTRPRARIASGRGAARGRHPRADPAGRRVRRPRRRGRRRAAPLRRRAAQGADAGSRAARAAHDGDADPRTLALTVYGDLAVSEIAKPPASRKPIITSWITEEKAPEAYTRLTRLLDEGRRPTSSARSSRRRRRRSRAPPRTRPSGSAAPS